MLVIPRLPLYSLVRLLDQSLGLYSTYPSSRLSITFWHAAATEDAQTSQQMLTTLLTNCPNRSCSSTACWA